MNTDLSRRSVLSGAAAGAVLVAAGPIAEAVEAAAIVAPERAARPDWFVLLGDAPVYRIKLVVAPAEVRIR